MRLKEHLSSNHRSNKQSQWSTRRVRAEGWSTIRSNNRLGFKLRNRRTRRCLSPGRMAPATLLNQALVVVYALSAGFFDQRAVSARV